MNATFYIKLYLLTIPVFFLIDLIWIGGIAKNMYQEKIGHLLAEDVKWKAAALFYFTYIVGIIVFAVVPALNSGQWKTALLNGALFGFFTYATYDLTNLATLKNWPITVTIADILWGMFLCGIVSISSFFIGKWLL